MGIAATGPGGSRQGRNDGEPDAPRPDRDADADGARPTRPPSFDTEPDDDHLAVTTLDEATEALLWFG
jgi:hypothetical protein